MKFKELFENTGNIIKLSDLYDEDDLNNPYEMMTHFISDEDLENQFEVKIMTPEMGKSLTTTGDSPVLTAYKDFATNKQKELVKQKMKKYDKNRIIVIMNKTVLDGNHHLIAGILSNNPIKYIDLDQPINKENV